MSDWRGSHAATTPHLCFAGASFADQVAALDFIIRQSPVLMRSLQTLRDMDLPDSWVVSGAIYNQVWNHLTGRPEMYGVKDIDIFYFDPDTSWAAEDRQIRRAARLFAPNPPVELRNQARVHLWYRDHFGHDYPQLRSSSEGVDHFACITHCVAARLTGDRLEIYAPYGLDDLFAFRLNPNYRLPNRATHEAKAARQKALWSELEVVPWVE